MTDMASPGPPAALPPQRPGPRPRLWSAPMVRGGVAAPGDAGMGDLPGGCGVVEAERVGDDRGRCLLDKLAQCGDAGVDEGEAEGAQPAAQGAVGDRLPGQLAREQPTAGVLVGVGGEPTQQRGERFGDRAGWVARTNLQLAVVHEVIDAQAVDPAQWLGVEQWQTRR